ncbi:hypothetical protein, partial [Xanthomonas vasicola]|uniref:hypothetical protein n=1 Tax=Xanthomonas vasicola TaxID=56459 RepID=UPI003CCEB355
VLAQQSIKRDSLVGRGCCALATRQTHRKHVLVGTVAASMPRYDPANGKGTAPEGLPVAFECLAADRVAL